MHTAHYPPAVLTKAFTWAYQELGLSAADAANMLGINEAALLDTALVGFPTESPQTHLQLAFIRFYYQLITTFSGDTDAMRGWFYNQSPSLQTVPAALCHTEEGITRLIETLTLLTLDTHTRPANDQGKQQEVS